MPEVPFERESPPTAAAENVELIARRAHHQWRRRRTAAGWRCGPRRDEQRKEDAALFDFDLLPPAEHYYLQAIVEESLQGAMSLGWLPPIATADADPDTASAAETPLVRPETLENWQALKAAAAETPLDDARRVSEELVRLGESVLAYNYTLWSLEHHRGDVRLRQLLALALSRCGAHGRANALLSQLRGEGHADEQSLELSARTCKSLWTLATDPASRETNLRQAHDLFLAAYRSGGGVGSGMNAASTALWLGRREMARELAREVHERCLAEINRSTGAEGGSYGTRSALGEACLLLGDLDSAWHWYGQAAAVVNGQLGDLHSTRRQARLVLGALGLDPRSLDAALPMPKVALFCASPQAWPNSAMRALTLADDADAAAAMQQALRENNVGIGFAAVANDVEAQFIESLRERRGLAYAVMPFERGALSGDEAAGAIGQWRERLDAALRSATQVHAVSEFGVPSHATAAEYAQAVMYGLARLQADALETDLIGLAIEGGNDQRAVQRWRQLGLEVKTLNLPGQPISTFAAGESLATSAVATPPADGRAASKIVAILFAEVTGFSKLDEGQVPLFVRNLMELVAESLAGMKRPPLSRNIWGDRLHLVFANLRDAGLCALRLCERSASSDWREQGLPADLAMRFVLHAGPAWHCDDPVSGTPVYSGVQVSRAARIEPLTPPGQVYASQVFAALAAAEGARDLAFDPVGRVPLANDHGTLPTYHVRRRGPT